jgi:hypothetical protein
MKKSIFMEFVNFEGAKTKKPYISVRLFVIPLGFAPSAKISV